GTSKPSLPRRASAAALPPKRLNCGLSGWRNSMRFDLFRFFVTNTRRNDGEMVELEFEVVQNAEAADPFAMPGEASRAPVSKPSAHFPEYPFKTLRSHPGSGFARKIRRPFSNTAILR